LSLAIHPWKKLALAAVALGALAAAWRYSPLADFLTLQRVSAWASVVRSTPWAPFAVVLAYAPAAALMFPQPLLVLFTVIAFGSRLGPVYAMTGILFSALACYAAGRRMRYESVERLSKGRLETARSIAQEHGVLAVFAANLVPVPPFAVQSAMAGALRIKLWQFIVGTALGTAPGVLAFSFFGRQIGAALEGDAKVSYALVMGALFLFAVFTIAAKRWASRRYFTTGGVSKE
jgi:phospholipase D1/2